MRSVHPALRGWLVVAAVLLLIGTYWVVWAAYVKLHTVTRYVAAAPGEVWTHDGQSLQLTDLVRTDTLSSKSPGTDPQVAAAGSDFVVATLTYRTDHDLDYGECRPNLIGRRWEVWEPILPDVSRTIDSSCSDLKAGTQIQVEVIYEIASQSGDQLLGLAVDDPGVIDRVPVLTPPS